MIKRNIYLNQEVAAEHFPSFVAKDLMLLDWFQNFVLSGEMKVKVVDGRPYYWVYYPTVLKQMPLLRWKTTDPVYRSFKRMVKAQVLSPHPDNIKDSESYYAFGPRFKLFAWSGTNKPVENNGASPAKIPGQARRKYRADSIVIDTSVIDTLVKRQIPVKEATALCEYLAKKKKLKYAEDIVEVIQHFNAGHSRSTKVDTTTYVDYILKRLEEEYSVADLKLVIDYKRHFFTHVVPNKANMNLDTYLRDSKFPGNLDKAQVWNTDIKEQANPESWKGSDNPRYVKFMAWYHSGDGRLKDYPISQAEFEDFLSGRVECPTVKKSPETAPKQLLRTIQALVKKGQFPNGERMMQLIVRTINFKTEKV